MRLTFVIFLVFLMTNSYGQSEKLIKEARALFDNQTILNSITLHGFFNDENEVHLYLAYDEDSYMGFCHYPSSDTRIRIEGGIVRDQLVLYETDRNGLQIGMWKIDVNDTEHKAVWRDMQGKSSFKTTLRKFNPDESLAAFYGPYFSIYDARIDGEDYRLKFQRIRGQNIRCTFMNFGKRYYYPLVSYCLDEDCNSFEISLDSHEGKRKMIFSDAGYKRLRAELHFKDKQTREIIFYEISRIRLKEEEYLGKLHRIHFSYPMPAGDNAEGYVGKEMKKILDIIKKEMENCTKNEVENESRLNYYANGWFDPGMINEDIYSGVLTVQSDCFDEIRTFPLTINARTGSRIRINDQFQRGYNLKLHFRQYLNDQFRTIPEFNSSIFRGYLKPNSFSNIYLSDQGIVFATDFNTILGTQRIILPYSDIKDQLGRKSILRKVIRN